MSPKLVTLVSALSVSPRWGSRLCWATLQESTLRLQPTSSPHLQQYLESFGTKVPKYRYQSSLFPLQKNCKFHCWITVFYVMVIFPFRVPLSFLIYQESLREPRMEKAEADKSLQVEMAAISCVLKRWMQNMSPHLEMNPSPSFCDHCLKLLRFFYSGSNLQPDPDCARCAETSGPQEADWTRAGGFRHPPEQAATKHRL